MIDNKIMVYAAGVFDILHIGHIQYLQKAKLLGDILVVGLLTDKGTESYKFCKPIMNYEERWDIIGALRCVDYIVRQENTDPTKTLISLKEEHGWIPDIMVRGDDYKGIPPGTKFIEEHGGKIIRLPYTQGISSSKIKLRIKKNGYIK